MTSPRILIAGIGNIFLGDDAFGVEVVRRLATLPIPQGVRIVDFGIRGLDLTYALLDSCDVAILVDAVPRGNQPGTLYVIEPDPVASPTPGDMQAGDVMLDTHNMDPVKVLRLVAYMGGHLQRIIVVGCEPQPLESQEDMAMALSVPVQAAVEEAVKLVESLVSQIQNASFSNTTSVAIGG